jgi:hypothetical protein
MNKITDRVKLGTFGELLVQLRLLEFDVQAAQPLKDSGNDLIAIRGDAMRAIQVKATKIEDDGYRVRGDLPERYHALAIVKFDGGEGTLYLDQSRVFLIAKEDVGTESLAKRNLRGMFSVQTLLTGCSRTKRHMEEAHDRCAYSLAYQTGRQEQEGVSETLEHEEPNRRSHRTYCGVLERLTEDRRLSIHHLALGPRVLWQLQVLRHSRFVARLGRFQRAGRDLLQR